MAGIAFTGNMSGSGDEKNKDETKPGGSDVRARVSGDENWVGAVVMVSVGWPSEPDAAESAVETDLKMIDIRELNNEELFQNIV